MPLRSGASILSHRTVSSRIKLVGASYRARCPDLLAASHRSTAEGSLEQYRKASATWSGRRRSSSLTIFLLAKQFKRARRQLRRLKTFLGRVMRDIERRVQERPSLNPFYAINTKDTGLSGEILAFVKK
jgi:hypothetical protein